MAKSVTEINQPWCEIRCVPGWYFYKQNAEDGTLHLLPVTETTDNWHFVNCKLK